MLAAVKRQQAKPLSHQKLREKVKAQSVNLKPLKNILCLEKKTKRGHSGEVVLLPRGFAKLDRPTAASATIRETAEVDLTS